MVDSSNTIANQALQYAGDNMPPVTGESPTFDDSTAGQALQLLYDPCVQTVARQFGYDFNRNQASLTVAAAPTPPAQWSHQYLYPTNGIQVRQVMPATFNDDPNDPLPYNWSIGNVEITGVSTKVIWTDFAGAIAVITNQPAVSTWDALFREAVVRLLASELDIALNGRPESSKLMLDTAGGFQGVSTKRDS